MGEESEKYEKELYIGTFKKDRLFTLEGETFAEIFFWSSL
jgi:hypothetical protein